jgi:hypothetical protein
MNISRNNCMLTIIVVFTFLSVKLHCQVYVYNIPLDTVEKRVTKDPEYLVRLNLKCIYPDSALSIAEYFDLYYGSAYIKGYSPYGEGVSERTIHELLQQEKYAETIEMCNDQILSHPGYITPFYYLGLAYHKLGDTITSEKFINKYYDYLSIPYFSGTGNSADSAFIVRSVDDEYLITGELGFQVKSQALIFNHDVPYDILYITQENDTTTREMYFNVSQPYLLGLNFLDHDEKSGKKDKKKKHKNKF